jgi:Domain of unknown function (DUF4249)
MTNKLIILGFSIITLFCFSCQDVILIEVKEGKTQLAVDAWLTDEAIEQSIVLTNTQSYFDSTKAKPALGATVVVYSQDSTAHVFVDKTNTGVYTYTPKDNNYLKAGELAFLSIKYQNEEYNSVSKLNRVPKIDSLRYEVFSFPVNPPDGGPKNGYLAEFYAKDFKGEGDTYLIRHYKNDTLKFKPNEFSLAYDGGFSPGSRADDLMFILPLRQSINSKLYLENEKVKVEIFSIPNEAFYFFQQLRQEANNGGIFATPLNNVPTNIINVKKQNGKKAVGIFFVSKVSRFETKIDKKLAKPKR